MKEEDDLFFIFKLRSL